MIGFFSYLLNNVFDAAKKLNTKRNISIKVKKRLGLFFTLTYNPPTSNAVPCRKKNSVLN